jgi:hypothetical protein
MQLKCQSDLVIFVTRAKRTNDFTNNHRLTEVLVFKVLFINLGLKCFLHYLRNFVFAPTKIYRQVERCVYIAGKMYVVLLGDKNEL